jgi:hypothetical protein
MPASGAGEEPSMSMRWRTWNVLIAGLLVASFGLGARSCTPELTAETDKDRYFEEEEGVGTFHNGGDRSTFLAGCSAFTFQQMVAGRWQEVGPAVVCFWEGIAREVLPGGELATSFAAPEPGTWRLRYGVSFGCQPGQPLSRADCTSQEEVYSPAFTVIPAQQ